VLRVPRPADRPGWAGIDIAYAGICGSDLHICAGEHPRAEPGITIGHEFVGTLTSSVQGLDPGTPVFANPMIHCGACTACRRGLIHICASLTAVGVDYPGGIAEHTVVPAYGLSPLPPRLNLRDAALIEPLAVGVHAVRRSGLQIGDRVHVIGAGPIGCILGVLAKVAGASAVTVSEPSPVRAAMAEKLGLTVVEAADGSDPEPDIVFEASGHPSVAPAMLAWLRPGGTLVVVGGYTAGVHGVDLHGLMFAELTVVGTRIYTRIDIESAIGLIASDRIDAASFITAVYPLDRAAEAVQQLREGRAMKILIQPAAGTT
jgi:(R,R)-butanediol dehydrogenase / meso-butanediol dehydrogenase / diacetyl reductase